MIKSIENFWVDENGNKWNKEDYTKNEASRLSKTLIYCKDCTDCTNCTYCENCTYCTNCRNCKDCTDCTNCGNCTDCTDCTYCRNCTDCTYCGNCTDCTDCTYCRNCTYCRDFSSNPERIISKKIGSRNSQTTIYFNSEKTLVICGCFKDSLEKFEKKVKETYPDNEGIHRKEYDRFIAKVKQYME